VDEVVEVVLSEVALGGVDGSSSEEADHFVEEAVSGVGDEEAVISLNEVGPSDCTMIVCVRGFGTAVGREGAEVVGALVEGEGLGEVFGIEKAGEMPRAFCVERGKDGEGAEFVGVGFFFGRKAGVEVSGDFLASHDANGGGKFGVESRNPVEGVHCEVVWSGEVGDLAEGVDAGVGAAGAVKADRFLGDVRHGGFDTLLDGVGIGLDLPAAEVGAVVGDGKLKMHDLPTEVVFENFESGSLVDDAALLFGFLSGGAEFF